MTNLLPFFLEAQNVKIVRWPESLTIVAANDSSHLLDAIDMFGGSFVRFNNTVYLVNYDSPLGTDSEAYRDTSSIYVKKLDVSKNRFKHLEQETVIEPNRQIFKAVTLRVDSTGFILMYKNWNKNLTLEKKFTHSEMSNFKEIYTAFRKQVLFLTE